MVNEIYSGRERVRRAIEHQAIDRVPLDLGCHFSTGISIFAYQRLREYLGLSVDRIELIDCTQLLARVDDDVLDMFHIDTVLLNPPFMKTHAWQPREGYCFQVPEAFCPIRQPDGGWVLKGEHWQSYMPAGGFFFDGYWPDFYMLEEASKLKYFGARAERLFKETGRFTIFMGYSAFFDGLDFACDMLTDPEKCIEINKERLDAQIGHFNKMNALFGRYIGAIEVNSDLGMQSAPMVSPASYGEICMPYLKKFCEHVHNSSGIKVFMHSCGSIAKLLPAIIEAGVDVINPVQISAADMNAAGLKARYGRDICFWGGGCDTQNVLWCASPDMVKAHVQEQMRILKPESGFVFNQVHNIMGNVPPENIVAMLSAAYENSAYEEDS